MNSEPAASLRPCKIHRLKETIAISIPTRACRHRLLLFAASAWAAGLLSSAAMAQAPSAYREIRLGLLAHDVAFTGGVEPGADINFEVTSSSIIDQEWTGSLPIWAQWAVHPRLHLGVEINTAGATNNVYAGLTWTANLAEDLFRPGDGLESSYLFGPALNDGRCQTPRPDRKSLGANVLFHLGAEITYRISPTISIGIYYDHESNGGLVRYNRSLNDFGARVAYRF